MGTFPSTLMTSMIPVVISGAVFALSALGFAVWQLDGLYERAALEVCSLVETHYFKSREASVVDFITKCRREAQDQEFLLSKSANVARINDRLAELGTSHLFLYSPVENKQLWEHVALDTGIRSRFVEDKLVVGRIVPKSAAYKAGLQVGDELISVDGQVVKSGAMAQEASGEYLIKRRGRDLNLEIFAEKLTEDLSPTLESFELGVAVVKIPSFLAQYFEDDKWISIVESLPKYRRVVVDLRDNAGGSFPAMLRALSPFRCSDPEIGRITQPQRTNLEGESYLLDDLDTESQLVQLASARDVRLRSFEGYGCFQGEVIALIDAGSGSVAEIFAQAILERKNAGVWGQPSSGQVVMARWFPVQTLGGEDYAVSIPIAGYRTSRDEELENVGIIPSRALHYDLERALLGRDSWIESAIRDDVSK